MIKLIFNRFAGEVMEQTAKYNVLVEAEAKGTAKTASDINEVKKAITDVSSTPLTISTKDIGSSVNKINEIKSLLTNLKNTKVDFSGSLGGLRSSGLLDVLPNGIKSSVEQLANLQNIINDPAKFSAFTKDLDSLSKGLSDVSSKSKDAANGQRSLKKTIEVLKDPVQSLTKVIKKLDYTQLVNMWRTIRRISTGLVGIIENAAGYEESLNLYRMALGTYHEEGTKWAERISDKLMLDKADIYQYTGAFFNLAKGMGVTGDAAYKMSTNLTQLTYDMASYLNISNEAAKAKIQSTMAGQSRAVATVGVATQMASLQELAYSLNIKKKVKDMTQAEKTYLRYIQLMRSTTQMQGDLGRTMMTPANAIRTLKNQINLLARSIGQILIPILSEVIPYIIAFTNVIRNLINTFSKYKVVEINYDKINFSFEDAIEGADNLDNLGKAATKAGKSVNESLAPFDELNNVISEASGVGGSGGIGSGGDTIDKSFWDDILPEYDMLKDYTDELNKKAKDLEGTVAKIAGIIGGIIATSIITSSIIKLAEFINALKTIKDSWNAINTATNGWAGILGRALTTLAGIGIHIASLNSLIEQAKNDDVEKLTKQPDWRGSTQSVSEDLTNVSAWGTVLGGAVAGWAVGGPLGGVIGASVAVKNAISEANNVIKTNYDLMSAQYGLLLQSGKEVSRQNENIAKGLSSLWSGMEKALLPVSNAENMYNKLKDIVDENGKVIKGHEAEAQAIVGQLNTALGTNIKIRDGQIQGYQKIQQEISKLIEKKKAEIKMQVMEEAYTQGLIDEKKALEALNIAQKNRNQAEEAYRNSANLSKDAQDKLREAYEQASREYDEASTHYQETISSKMSWEEAYSEFLQGHYDKVNEIFENSSKKSVEYTRQALVESTNAIKGDLGEEQLAAWRYLAQTSTSDFNEALLQIGDENVRNQIIDSIAQLGMPLSKEGQILGTNYANNFLTFTQHELDDGSLEVEIGLNQPSDSLIAKMRDGIKGKFNKNPITLDLTTEGSWIQKAKNAIAGIKFRASGGYLDSGDLFFANENGVPEYITSVGNKSAVINQGQMIATLSNAIVAGFQQFGGNQPNNVVVYVGDKKLYEGQGEYQNRQNDRYGTTVVKI